MKKIPSIWDGIWDKWDKDNKKINELKCTSNKDMYNLWIEKVCIMKMDMISLSKLED